MARAGRFPLQGAERAAMFRQPRWLPIVQTMANLAVYAAAAVVVTADELGPARFAVWPLMSLVLAGCIAAGHDCFHNALFGSKRANRIAGAIWCAVVLNNFSALKYAHLVHHRHTRVEGDSESPFDVPNLAAYAGLLFFSIFSIPRAALKAVRIATGRLQPPYLTTPRTQRDARLDSGAVLVWLAIAGALTVYAPLAMTLIYWVPLAFFPPMALSIAMPEHHGCEGPDLFAATRTTKSNWFARMLIWNSNYHVEHHLYPGVPSCNLPAVHRKIQGELAHCSPGYLAFHLGLLRDYARARRATTANETKSEKQELTAPRVE
jgi:fatty acid desaturase